MAADDHADDLARTDVATFAALQSLLITIDSIRDFLDDVAALAATSLLPGPVSCGITARYDDSPLTVASSDAGARLLDESQYAVGEGTCLHAMVTGEVVYVPDVAVERRWPGYLEIAREHGLRSSLSLPLLVGDASVGALNLYSWERADAFKGAARAAAEGFASQASTVLLLGLRHLESSETTRQLEEALVSRSVIDQALGVIMGRQGGSAAEAFAILRAHSQHNNRKLRAVAEELVASAQARAAKGR